MSEPRTLDKVTVTAPVSPLDAPLLKVRRLGETTLPCMGCDGIVSVAPNAALSLLEFLLLPTDPPMPDAAARVASDVRHAPGPDLGWAH